MERTFMMVKPDGVQRNLIGEIVQRFERKGFQLVGAKHGKCFFNGQGRVHRLQFVLGCNGVNRRLGAGAGGKQEGDYRQRKDVFHKLSVFEVDEGFLSPLLQKTVPKSGEARGGSDFFYALLKRRQTGPAFVSSFY